MNISKVFFSDLTGLVSCTFEADQESIKNSTSISLGVLARPRLQISNLTVTVEEGSDLTLTCDAYVPDTGHPGVGKACHFKWYSEGGEITNGGGRLPIKQYYEIQTSFTKILFDGTTVGMSLGDLYPPRPQSTAEVDKNPRGTSRRYFLIVSTIPVPLRCLDMSKSLKTNDLSCFRPFLSANFLSCLIIFFPIDIYIL